MLLGTMQNVKLENYSNDNDYIISSCSKLQSLIKIKLNTK